jgi:hypothetical protein
MAEERREEESVEPRDSRVPWTVMIVLGVLLAIGGVALGKKEKKSKPPPPEQARALVVPTAERAHKVVVAPCEASPEEVVRDAAEERPTPNAVTLSLPRGEGVRAVLVPHCVQGTGTAGGRAPSAAFVLPSERGAERAQSRLVLPPESEAETIVIPRCRQEPERRDVVLSPQEGDGAVAVAPGC